MAASLSSKQNQMETTVNPLKLTERHFIPKIPLAESRKRKKCVCCNAIGERKDTTYHCRICNVALCIESCFELYHTKKDFKGDQFNDNDYSNH